VAEFSERAVEDSWGTDSEVAEFSERAVEDSWDSEMVVGLLGLEAGSLDSEVGHWDSEEVDSAGESDLRSVEELLGLGVDSLDLEEGS
jgi:hypothetical protein